MKSPLPGRKNPRLPDFDYSQAGYYFVTVCTKDRRCTLCSVVGGDAHIAPVVGGDAHIAPQVELTSTGSVVERYLRTIPGIDKYCIMPNHIHMIIRIEPADGGPMWASAPTQALSQRVRSFKTLVAKALGAPLFQRSFYDHVIRSDEDYRRIWQYIDDNPAKWAEDEYFAI